MIFSGNVRVLVASPLYVCVSVCVCVSVSVQTETKNLLGQAVNQLRVLRCAARVCSQFQPVGWLWVSRVECGVRCAVCREKSLVLHYIVAASLRKQKP